LAHEFDYVWRYALLAMHARKEEDDDTTKLTCSCLWPYLFFAGVEVECWRRTT